MLVCLFGVFSFAYQKVGFFGVQALLPPKRHLLSGPSVTDTLLPLLVYRLYVLSFPTDHS